MNLMKGFLITCNIISISTITVRRMKTMMTWENFAQGQRI